MVILNDNTVAGLLPSRPVILGAGACLDKTKTAGRGAAYACLQLNAFPDEIASGQYVNVLEFS